MGLDHKDTHCVTPGDPEASAGSLVGRVRVQKVIRLLPTHLWVKPGPGIGAGPLTAKPYASVWWQSTGVQRWCQIAGGGGGQFLTHLVMGSGVSQSLYWPASRQSLGPTGHRARSGLLMGWLNL